MEDYIGKVCPFCKTEIKEEDTVIICPSCDIPHHQECWNENSGCSTFGCTEQSEKPLETNITDTCENCGTTLGNEQEFCPNCGTRKSAQTITVCSKCGTELQEGQEFCSQCGQKIGLAVDSDVTSSIDQFNASVEKKKKNSKTLPIVIAVAMVALSLIGFFIYNTIQEKKLEEAKATYISDVKTFASMSLTAGANLEDISDTVQSYWHDSIFNDYYYGSIDLAIYEAMQIKSEEVSEAESQSSEMEVQYKKIRTLPDGVEDADLEDICDAAKSVYQCYLDYYNFATDPSGNYTSFCDGNYSRKSDFISQYQTLDMLLD